MKNLYSFHLDFADGSNPYFSMPCEYRKHIARLRKWEKNYTLTVISRMGNLIFLLATPIITTKPVFFEGE